MNTSNNYLAAILFADISGYTALMEKDMSKAMDMLKRYEEICKTLSDKYSGEIVKNYGDGSLLTFKSAVNAVSCAEEIQLKCREYPQIPLRIGLHIGEITEQENDVFGNAVNIASRIESMCTSGGILFSKDIFEQIKNLPRLSVEALGEFEFKNVEKPMEVYALVNHNFPVPEKDKSNGKLKSKQKQKVKIPLLAWVLLTLSLLGFSGYQLFKTANKVHVITLDEESEGLQNSIAILPFENMSDSKDNQYFTDGMHDDLLTFLSKAKHLKVISKTSVSQLKDSDQTIEEIANLLGVSHVMEGSVRRIDNQVRINVQLIDAKTDNSLWAEIYDKEVSPKNIFEIQSEIATKISSTLIESVFAETENYEPSKYTENLEAYENFLRAKQLKETGNRESLVEAKRLLENALQLDESFAEAMVLLGNVHIHLVYYGGEDPEEYFPKSWEYMEKAMELKPNISDAYALKGSLYHWWKKDFAGANEAYEKAIEIKPNSDNALYGLAIAYQDLNINFERIESLLQRALTLNPLNPNLISSTAIYQRESGNLNGAIRTLKKGIEIAPKHPNLWVNYAGSYYYNSKFDSVAIISHQCVEQNGKNGQYLQYYFEALSNISALPELKKELDELNPDTNQEEIIKLNYLREYYFQKKNFMEVEKLTERLSEYNANWTDAELYKFENAHYQGQFEKAINLFENDNKDVAFDSIVNNYTGDDINSVLRYIHALQQTGNDVKATELIALIKREILKHTETRNKRLQDVYFLDYIRSCIATLSGDEDDAVQYLDSYMKTGNSYNIRWIEQSPIFSSLHDNQQFVDMLNGYRKDISEKRGKFREYLIEKK